MENCYRLPITKEYTSRGCTVKIDAASSSRYVDVEVTNNKTHKGSNVRFSLKPGSDDGYSNEDMCKIHSSINQLLDQYGDVECNNIHFTNQILS